MHAAFDCMHASCITGGAVYIDDGSIALFRGETLFASNTAEIGGTTVTCTRLNESQITTSKTSSRKGMSW